MPHQEAVAITINSIQRQNYVLASRNAVVEWSKSLQQTGTARWKMAGVDGDWVPLVGQAFGIYDTSVPGWGDPWQLGLIFAGSIDSVTPEKPAAPVQPDWLEIEVTGSSREQTLQRRLIRPFGFGYRYSRYKDMTAGAIAQAVLTDFADGENLVITPANFDDGPTIPFVAWNHQTVAEALTQLADYAEMHWWIGPDSQVYFKEREAVPAPWGIVDGDNQCQRLSIRESRENLNNAVYYRTTFGAFADDPLPEFKNPSETVIVTTPGQTFFQTEMQIQEAVDIAMEIPGLEGRNPQEIEQVDGTEALFWYIPGDDGFSLTTGKTLPDGAQITFHYNRLGGDVIPVEDLTAIAERAAVELVGSGRYELAVANTAYTSRAAAEQRASMIIQQRRNTAMVIDGETMRKGLDVGQWLVVSTSNPPINDTFLITSVTARAVLGTSKISFSFSGVNGNKLPNGWDFFTGLGDAGFGGGFGAGFQGAGMVGGGGGAGVTSPQWTEETPVGVMNTVNPVFELSRVPSAVGAFFLFLNGVEQVRGLDFKISGIRIHYTWPPKPEDNHHAKFY